MIADVGLGELLWSLLVLYLIVHLLIVTFIVVLDLIRSDDISGFAKAGWALVLLVVPLLGLLAYLIVRGDGIGARNLAREQATLPPPPGPPPGATGVTAEIESAARLRDAGSISDEEFQAIKAKLLS